MGLQHGTAGTLVFRKLRLVRIVMPCDASAQNKQSSPDPRPPAARVARVRRRWWWGGVNSRPYKDIGGSAPDIRDRTITTRAGPGQGSAEGWGRFFVLFVHIWFMFLNLRSIRCKRRRVRDTRKFHVDIICDFDAI